jgi:hypothetical protein
MKRRVAEMSGDCPMDSMKVAEVGSGGDRANVDACGRTFFCRMIYTVYGQHVIGRAECEETLQSQDRAARALTKVSSDDVIARLAFEAKCEAAQVAVASKADGSATGGDAYRMTACGKPYLCVTSPGRIECKLDPSDVAAAPK